MRFFCEHNGQKKVVRSQVNSLAELRNEISRVHGIPTPFTPQIFVVHSTTKKKFAVETVADLVAVKSTMRTRISSEEII